MSRELIPWYRQPNPALGLIQEVNNVSLLRAEPRRAEIDERRDYARECGYPTSLDVDDYVALFEREGLAARVVELIPRESWFSSPLVFEDSSEDVSTPFEEDWAELHASLSEDEESFFNQEEGSPIWDLLQRADVLSGVGYFGIIVLGIDDGRELSEPADLKAGNKRRKLLWAQAYGAPAVAIGEVDEDRNSRRYGRPVTYNINTCAGASSSCLSFSSSMPTLRSETLTVHWTRAIHLADNALSSQLYGTPRMQQVFNRLADARKMYSAAPEMFWRGAFPGWAFVTHPQLGGDVRVNVSKLQEQMTLMGDGLQRFIALMGMAPQSLAPQVVDPSPQMERIIEYICITLDCPKRIFMGSERGELASTQDEKRWRKKMVRRQNDYLIPRVIVPFVNRLVLLGVLSEPSEFSVQFPDEQEMAPAERSSFSLQMAQAFSAYISGGGDTLMSPRHFLREIVGLPAETVEGILEDVQEHITQKKADALVDMEEEMKLKQELEPEPPPGMPPQE